MTSDAVTDGGFLGREVHPDAVPTRIEEIERVVICGAGPTGLVAALTLVRQGVPVTVLEKLPHLSHESRASTFHPPTLELLDELGVATDVLAAGLRAPTTQFRDRVSGPVATFDLGVLRDETAFPFRIQLEQSKLTPMLVAELERGRDAGEFDIELRFGHRSHRAEMVGEVVHLLVGTTDDLIEFRVPLGHRM